MWRAVLASCQLPVFTGEFDLPGNCPSPSPLCCCPEVCEELCKCFGTGEGGLPAVEVLCSFRLLTLCALKAKKPLGSPLVSPENY